MTDLQEHTRQATIYPGGRRFTPKPGSWLEGFVSTAHVKTLFVSAEDDPELLIGTIERTGTRYRQRMFRRAIRSTSAAKTVPTMLHERLTNSISTAVWDLRRRHRVNLEGGADK